MADSPLTASLAALSRFFVGDGSLVETLDRVAHLTVEAVEPVDLCGITMLIEGRPRTAVFTDETAPEVDEAQYDTGEGPCLAAFQTVRVLAIDSTTEPGPWPEFRRAAAAHGIHSTLRPDRHRRRLLRRPPQPRPQDRHQRTPPRRPGSLTTASLRLGQISDAGPHAAPGPCQA